MASDLSSGCTETIDIFDEKEEGEISLEDVSSSEEGGIGHLTCGYVVRSRRSCTNCRLTGECASWCTTNSKAYCSKSQNRRDPVKGKENRHHVNEVECATTKHATSMLQEKNDDLVPISSDSDMEIVGITDASKQLTSRSSTRIRKKKRKKEDHEYLTIDDLISPSSIDLSISDCFSDCGETSVTRGIGLNKTRYRESSPFRRNGRSRMITKSPLRKYKSPVRTRSSFGSSLSPLNRSRLPPVGRRSPRRLKTPRRSSSPYRSPVRKTSRKSLRPDASPPSPTCAYVDRHGDVTRLLKKVKHLDSMGVHTPVSGVDRNKGYQPASLRKKLSNMMKRVPDGNGNVTPLKAKSSIQPVVVHDIDDEEDLALLRQKALETKQKNRGIKPERPIEAESEKKPDSVTATKSHDDQDKEDLELRMIALRSAVMKKHQNRIQRGIRAKNKKTAPVVSSHSVSPFTQSFLNNIPVPGDEPLCTSPLPPPSMDSNHIEDMELDTDVEREKEKLSDSPTVKITADVPIDTELLGIDPSDVSFINFADADNNSISTTMKDKFKYSSADDAVRHFMHSPSPQDSDVSFHMNWSNDQRELPNYLKNLHRDSIECDLIDGICCQGDIYSSTNTPMYEGADISSRTLPVTADLPVSSMSPKHVSQQTQNITQSFSDDLLTHVQLVSKEQLSTIQDKCVYDAVSRHPVSYSPPASALGSTSPKGSMMTINHLPETEKDPVSPVIFIDGHAPSIAVDYIPNDELSRQTGGTASEPLYIQGVPGVTKDINKIPTLINRTLVPAPILKSNKQLQQPLPPSKKYETHPEPTFKSAEMQPVIVTTDANSKSSNTTFKPIKLVSFAKKPCSVLTTPVVFNDSVNESLENDASKSDSHKAAEPKQSVTDTTATNNDIVSAHKKRKRVKKNRRKSHDTVVSLEDGKDNSCINDVNKDVNIITTICQRQIVKSDQNINNDDNKARESLTEKKKSLNLLNIPSMQNVPLSTDSSDIKVQNNSINRSEQCISSNDSREELRHETLSMISKQQEISIESSHRSVTNLDTTPPNRITELTKDVNDRRQSIDEDEDELRVILLASLAKRTTKSSDANSASTNSGTVVTTNCIITNAQQGPAQNTLANTLTSTTVNTTVSNKTPLPSTLDSSKISERVSDTTTSKETNATSVLANVDDKKKKPAATVLKGPPKKMMKKIPIPASTKVVNNAKKYQNMMLQRKLNLQKHDTNTHNKVKLKQDSVWSANAPTKASTKIHTPETQRIVINLGSDTDSESESEKHIANSFISSSNVVNASTQDTNADFEKSLHKFLRDMRKEQESAAAFKPIPSPQATRKDTPPTVQKDPDESSSNVHTPLAVRHLPASQQEEYRRLKRQILEREKLKLQRKVLIRNNTSNNGTNRSNKLLNNVSDSQSKSSLPCDKGSTSGRQNQVNLKEPEKNTNFQQTMGVGTKNIDIAKSTLISNTSRASVNKNISENVAKQTDYMHLPTKGAKKTIPNFSIRITNEIASTLTEDKIIESSVDSVSNQQPMSDKQQFRPAVRTLSKDEINKKYVQVRLKQDMIGRVVTINDKSLLRSNVSNIAQNERSIENNALEDLEKNVNKNCDVHNSSEFSNASTILLFNLSNDPDASKQEFTDTMGTTMSRSRYEREQEIHRNSTPFPENSSHNDNDISRKSDVYTSDDKDNAVDIWNALKRNVNAELDSVASLPETKQRRYLSDTEQRLVEKRYTVLDYLAEMSGTLRQWDMEKDLQSSLTTEVKNLKEQLRIAEEKLQEQRNRVSNNNDKISTTRQKINVERRECFKLLRICSTLGNQLLGKDYKLPEAGGQVLNNKLKEVANHIRQLSKKKPLSNDISENSMLSTSLLQTSSISEPFKIVRAKKNPQLEQLTDDAVVAKNIVELKDNTSLLELPNDTENVSTLDNLQSFPNQETPVKKNATATIVTKQKDNPDQNDVLLSEPRLCSTPISLKQNSECTQGTCDVREISISEPITIAEPILSIADLSLYEDSEQGNKKRTHLLSLSTTTIMTTTTTTTTTTTKTMATIQPYVSILTHLKTPRNANPNGILCPYDLMGICNDGDCRFVHQSTSHT